MYPTITDFLQRTFGIYVPLPIQTYGFFFVLSLITAAYIYYLEYKRKENEGKLIPFYLKEEIGKAPDLSFVLWNLFFSFIIAYKLVDALLNYSDFVANPQEMILSSRGNFWGGVLVALAYTGYQYWQKNKAKLPKPKIEYKLTYPCQMVGNMFVVVGIAGILGAKLFDVIQPQNISSFLKDPLGSLLSFSGLTFYGGIIGGFIAGIWFVKKYNINIINSLDSLAPAAAIGYGIGRIGCHVSGDGCWGIPNPAPKPDWLQIIPNWAWSYNYPNNVIHEHLEVPVFPTSFYEMLMMFVIFAILWALRKKIKIPGMLFAIYLIFSGIERYVIEIIRATHRYSIFGVKLSQAQIISIILFLIGVGMIVFMFIDKKRFYEYGTPEPKEINKPPKK